MIKYKAGQHVRIPGIRSEGIAADRAIVLVPPNRNGLMLVWSKREGEFEVATNPKTGKIVANIVGSDY